MSDFNFNLNMCSTLCSVQEQENDSGTHARRTSQIHANILKRRLSLRGAPAPWLATHSAQSQRNLLVAKMAESQTLEMIPKVGQKRRQKGRAKRVPLLMRHFLKRLVQLQQFAIQSHNKGKGQSRTTTRIGHD